MASGKSFRTRSAPLFRQGVQDTLVQHGYLPNYDRRARTNSIVEESAVSQHRVQSKTLRDHITSYLQTSIR
jgi:hypothetical protein